VLSLHSDWQDRYYLPLMETEKNKIASRFAFIVRNNANFQSVDYSTCAVFTKTIIHLSVRESSGYLPPLRGIIVLYFSLCMCWFSLCYKHTLSLTLSFLCLIKVQYRAK